MSIQQPELVAQWLSEHEAMCDSHESFKTRRSDVNQYVRWLNENGESFSPVDGDRHKRLLNDHLLDLKREGYARNTIISRWGSLKLLYDDLTGFYGEFDENPFENLRDRRNYLPKKTREETKSAKPYVRKEEKEQLCENVPSPAFRSECILRLMWQTGLRQGEVINLRLDDVNFEETKLDHLWSPKISAERTVTFKDSLVWWLDEWINGGYRDSYRGAKESDYLFLTNKSEGMHGQVPNETVRQAAENAGIQEVIGTTANGKPKHKFTSHAMRRGHAMHLLKNGVDLRSIQKRLGHSKLSTTVEYLPISPEDTSDKIQDISF